MRGSPFACLILVSFLAGCGDDDPGGGQPDAGEQPGNLDARVDAMPETGDVPRLEEIGCRIDVPAELGLVEGADYRCSELVVFEDRSQPLGATLRLHVLVFEGADTGAATVYLDGGPGGNGASIVAYLAYAGTPFLDGFLAAGDLVVLSQRGTTLSRPALDCESSGACEFLLGGEVQLSSFNTASSADDVDALRAAMGLDALNVYGISYGSRLSLEVLRRHGDRVRAAVIDGNVPAQVNWPASIPASFYSALTALDASCADDGGCAAAFGDLEADFVTGFDSLQAQPISFSSASGDVTLDGYTYAYVLFRIMYSRSSYPWLPMVISDLAERRTDRVADFLGMVLGSVEGGGSDLATGLYYSVTCGELFNPPDLDAFDEANADVPVAIRDIFAGNWYGMLDTCDGWAVGAPMPALSEPVTSSVRTLVASGAIDPITPPSFGQIAASTLSDRVEVLYANSGHGATLQTECGRGGLVGFLQDPEADPAVSCAGGIETDYVLPGAARASAARIDPALLALELERVPLPPPMREALERARGSASR